MSLYLRLVDPTMVMNQSSPICRNKLFQIILGGLLLFLPLAAGAADLPESWQALDGDGGVISDFQVLPGNDT
ncbi:MAG: hypothetical protein KAT58_11875, partial [candidate division Zixibacteria bacterium]|nr:hypothetical protein [candidate division Zixibacteria bacterium]